MDNFAIATLVYILQLHGLLLEIIYNILRDYHILSEAAANISKLGDTICKFLNDRTLGNCVHDYTVCYLLLSRRFLFTIF